MPLTVHHFQRAPGESNFSIERLFRDIRGAFPEEVDCRVFISRHQSQGIGRRLYNIWEAGGRAGPVNHITGDVHFLAYGLPRGRTILTVHDCGNLHRLTGWRRALLREFWFNGPIRRAAITTTISQATRQDLARLTGFPLSRFRVVPDCVSSEFQPHPKPWPERHPPVALMLGTAPNKNHLRVAEAASGLNLSVECVGALPPEIGQAFAHHKVPMRELGFLRDTEVLQAYQRCDFLLFPSTLEGFGMPILEAQATGRPVLTSQISSMPEVAGPAACYVDPHDPASIRGGIQCLLSQPDLRHRLVQQGFENVRRFHPKAVADAYLALYKQLLQSP